MIIRTLNNISFVKCSLHTKVLGTFSASRFSSQQVPAVQDCDEHHEKHLKNFQTITNVTKRNRTKQPQKPPFVKNLLLGKFDTDILTFPELSKEDTKNLETDVQLVRKLMKLDHMVQCTSMTKPFRQNLSDLKALALQSPQLMDGRECNITENSMFLEALSEHGLRNSLIHNENLGIQALNKFGNEQHKIKYLTRLMSGELLSASCISEMMVSDVNSLKTTAVLSSDEKHWILNGEKINVVNGKSANVLIVFAVTHVARRDVFTEARLTAFIVDKDSPGISIKDFNSEGIDMASIVFTNTPIPAENVIGEINKGQEILVSLTTDISLAVGTMCVSTSKNILNNLLTDLLNKSDGNNLLFETDIIRKKIGQMAISLYAMESVLYLTTGLIDNYENQDVVVESSIVKAFASDKTMQLATTAVEISGIDFLSDSHWLRPLFQEAIRFKTLNEQDDKQKIILTLFCLQHAGKILNDKVNKIRNPLFHSTFSLSRMWMDRRNNEDRPKLDFNLGDYLHPALLTASKQLEYCVKRIEFATEVLLVRHGPEVYNFHMDLIRLADAIICTYVLAACLGRSSRSYCIGLQHGDIEIMMAASYANIATETVKNNVLDIYRGSYCTNDENFRHISNKMFKYKEYFPKHPIARNF